MTKLALLSDVHFGKRSNCPEFNRQCVEIIKWVLDHCKKEKVRYGAFCGDWFNDRISVNSRTLHYSSEAFRLINDYFKSVGGIWYQIVGNHDLYYRQNRDVSSLSFLKEYSHIELIEQPQDIVIDKHIISMWPWLNDNDNLAKIVTESNGEILLCHGEFRGFKWNGNSAMLTKGIPMEMVDKFNAVFSGHYHLRQSEKNISYVGSPQQQDFGDSGNMRGFCILDLDNKSQQFIANDISSQYHIIPLTDLNGKLSLIPNNHIKIIEDVELHSDEFNKIHELLMKKEPLSLIFESCKKKEETEEVEVSDEDIESIESLLFTLIDGERSEERKNILKERM